MTPSQRLRLPVRRPPAPERQGREAGTTDAWAALWRMREYLRPYLARTALMLVLGLVGVITAVAVPLALRRVIDGPLAEGRAEGVPLLVALVAALGAVEAAVAFWRRWLQSTTAVAMERSMRDVLYATVQTLPPSFHDRWHTGQLLSRMTGDLSTIRRFSGFGLIFGVVNVISISVVSGLLIWLDPVLGVVVACSLVPITIASRRFGRRFGVVSRRVQDGQGDLTTLIEEAATGVRVVKAFGRREQLTERFRRDAEELRAVRLSMAYLRAHVVSVLGAIPNATLVLVLLLGSGAVASGRLTLGELVAFITLSLQLIWPIEATGFILASAQEAATASQRVYELVDTDPEIVSAATVHGLLGIGRRGVGGQVSGGIRFEDVSFSYPGSTAAVLDGVRLEIAPGETVALAGASGSGKTTLAALLPRLADPTSGRVLLDDHDLRDLPLPWLRTAVATGFEDPVLFSASVRENVTLGRPEATEDELHEALAVAQAGFAYDLPWGLETRIGEQGMSLSGGQRQRIALARAVLGRPRVLVLDDPLSALDVETEALVEQALRRVLAGTTALIVVHRPSTVALADRVALLHEGRLEAVGTHRELLATSPRYAALMGEEDIRSTVDVAGVDVAGVDVAAVDGVDVIGEVRR